MKVYHRYPRNSRGIGRTAGMMERYAPPRVTFTENERAADMVVIHVHGERDAVRRVARHTLLRGRRYAIVQHAFRSSQKPNAKEWEDIWDKAALVWSAYDLPALAQADGAQMRAPFYYAPYGGDAEVFCAPLAHPRRFVLGTNGVAFSAESMRECYYAAKRVGRPLFHVGTAMPQQDGLVEAREGISDAELAKWWGQCEFVAGLRHIEGFELPLVEGLLCGARPLTYDAPHYRAWYEPWAVFVPPYPTYAERVSAITDILRAGTYPITPQERADAARFFDWRRIVGCFWEKLCEQ